MIRSKNHMTGLVTFTVLDEKGNIKKFPKSLFRKIFHLPAKEMRFKHHNTITTQGDGLIADLMISSPTQKKVDATNGYMLVGTGWTGTSPKSNTSVNTSTGTHKKLDSGFPKTSAAFGSTGQNIVLYRTTFAVGSLNASGINEVALLNGNTSDAKCLAYAQISPSVNVTSSDSLQIDWQITVSGS